MAWLQIFFSDLLIPSEPLSSLRSFQSRLKSKELFLSGSRGSGTTCLKKKGRLRQSLLKTCFYRKVYTDFYLSLVYLVFNFLFIILILNFALLVFNHSFWYFIIYYINVLFFIITGLHCAHAACINVWESCFKFFLSIYNILFHCFSEK